MPWFVEDDDEELPMGMPRSMEAERGVRSIKEDRSWVGLDMAALRTAGERRSAGDSSPPSALPSSVGEYLPSSDQIPPLFRFGPSPLS